jgi:alpha-ketoglutarate-dependent taurine dioxygenase
VATHFSGPTLPLVLTPFETAEKAISPSDLISYAQEHERELRDSLHRHGALLFRDFSVEDAENFQRAVQVFAPALRNYQGGDSPRGSVTDKVYTSTAYPASLPIPLHNEMSYSRDYPALIAFYCEVAPKADGETPLADCRQVLQSLSADLLERFETRKLRYIQNLPDGAGLGKSWQATFETDDREQVEAILRDRGAEWEWRRQRGGALRVIEIVEPIITHPSTGEDVFFSQAHLWHVSSLDPQTRKALTRLVAEDDLYHHCTFGDGAPISEHDLLEIRRALEAATVAFPWRRHDVLLVDNLLVAHGRNPFAGERRILVALA